MDLSRRTLLTLALSGAAIGLTGCGINYPVKKTAKPLTWWFPAQTRPAANESLTAWAKEFNSALKVTAISDYPKTLAATLPTDQAPDVFEVDTIDPAWVRQELLTDLSSKLTGDDYIPGVIDSFFFRGRTYAIPHTVDSQFIAYRKSLLAKANVPAPKTFAELVDAAKATLVEARGGFYAGPDRGINALGYALVWAAGAQLIDPTTGRSGFAQPAFFDAVSAFRAATDLNRDRFSSDWTDPTPLTSGEVAMQWVGSWRLPELKDKLADDLGVLPFPGMVDPKYRVVPVTVAGTAVRAGRNAAAATDFATWLWLEQTDKQIKFVEQFGIRFPAKPALFEKCTGLTSGVGQAAATLVKSAAKSVPMAWTPVCANHFFTAINKSMRPDADVAAIITAAATAIDRELA